MPWRPGAECVRQRGQPFGDRRGLDVDNLVDSRLTALESGDGRSSGVVDVDEGPDACTITDHRHTALANHPNHPRRHRRAWPIESPVAEHETLDAIGGDDRLLQVA